MLSSSGISSFVMAHGGCGYFPIFWRFWPLLAGRLSSCHSLKRPTEQSGMTKRRRTFTDYGSPGTYAVTTNVRRVIHGAGGPT
jgi:hypothetical protein